MDDAKEIHVRLDTYLQSDGSGASPQEGSPGQAGTILPSQSKKGGMMIGAISAHLLISGASRMLAATGNQELANGIRETAEWTFLGLRAISMDPTAIATAAFKLSSLAIQKVTDYIEEQKEIAKNYNTLLYEKLRNGQLSITANTEVSYGKYGRIQLTSRR